MEKWAPTLVVLAIALLNWAVNYGAFGARIKTNETDIVELKKSRGDTWAKVNALDREVGEVKTKVGLRRSHTAGGD